MVAANPYDNYSSHYARSCVFIYAFELFFLNE